MKRFFRVTFLLAILLNISIVSFSQEVVTVTNKKAGKLSKAIKKIGTNTTHLKILGEMNSDDFEYLSGMNSLEYLDIEDVTLQNLFNNGKKINSKFLNDEEIILPDLSKVIELHLPLSCSKINQLYSVPSLKILHIPNGCDIINDSTIHLQEIYVKRGKYEGSSRYMDYYNLSNPKIHKLTTETLILSQEAFLKRGCDPLKNITPNFIFIEDISERYLNRWDDKYDIKDIENIDVLNPAAFANSNITSITIPIKIRQIPDNCFMNCLNLKEINLGSIAYIGEKAFCNTAIKKIIIPKSLTALNTKAFDGSQIEQVEFLNEYPPMIEPIKRSVGFNTRIIVFFDKIQFIIPVNTYSKFNIGEWKYLTLLEKGTKTDYEFTIDKPGTLSSFITKDIVKNITSLTIKGFLYDTDFEVLNKCENLSYLDLSYTFITKSPKTLKSEKANAEILIGLLSLAADLSIEEKNDKYDKGNISLGQNINNNLAATYLKELTQRAAKEEIKADPNCIIPKCGFQTKKLKEILLPLQLTKVRGLHGCLYLERVVLPPNLISIEDYTFSGCLSLKSITFPTSLTEIGEEAFKNCSSLEVIDLSETQVKAIWSGTFEGCKAVKEVRGNIGLKTFSTYSAFNSAESVKYYFKTLEKPNNFYSNDKDEIYIPKGAKAGWQGIRGNIIEEN